MVIQILKWTFKYSKPRSSLYPFSLGLSSPVYRAPGMILNQWYWSLLLWKTCPILAHKSSSTPESSTALFPLHPGPSGKARSSVPTAAGVCGEELSQVPPELQPWEARAGGSSWRTWWFSNWLTSLQSCGGLCAMVPPESPQERWLDTPNKGKTHKRLNVQGPPCYLVVTWLAYDPHYMPDPLTHTESVWLTVTQAHLTRGSF